jgi:hypothetical protein
VQRSWHAPGWMQVVLSQPCGQRIYMLHVCIIRSEVFTKHVCARVSDFLQQHSSQSLRLPVMIGLSGVSLTTILCLVLLWATPITGYIFRCKFVIRNGVVSVVSSILAIPCLCEWMCLHTLSDARGLLHDSTLWLTLLVSVLCMQEGNFRRRAASR